MQYGCPELEMRFSRAELDSRPGEARLVVQIEIKRDALKKRACCEKLILALEKPESRQNYVRPVSWFY